MAPDNWHHLEGAYPSARTFRLYVYDDYGRPLPADALRKVQARIVTKESFDPATRKTTEHSAFPLKVSRNRAYLEARKVLLEPSADDDVASRQSRKQMARQRAAGEASTSTSGTSSSDTNK